MEAIAPDPASVRAGKDLAAKHRHKTRIAPKHFIHNYLSRLTTDSPGLLAVIMGGGQIALVLLDCGITAARP